MNILPKEISQFHSKEYWNLFFKKRANKTFEWYGEYKDLREYLKKYLKEDLEILIIGCGNSELSSQMYDDGFKKITNIDFSDVVIKEMQKKNFKKRKDLKFIVMDILHMEFENESFDIILVIIF